MKKRCTEERITGFLHEADAGLPIKELCREHGFSEASYYAWKTKFGGMKASDAQRLKGAGGRERQAQATAGQTRCSKSTRCARCSRENSRRVVNGPEFAGRTMQTWAAKNSVELRFIQPGKRVQNAYIESFNSRFRDECLSQPWFASLSHMRSVMQGPGL